MRQLSEPGCCSWPQICISTDMAYYTDYTADSCPDGYDALFPEKVISSSHYAL